MIKKQCLNLDRLSQSLEVYNAMKIQQLKMFSKCGSSSLQNNRGSRSIYTRSHPNPGKHEEGDENEETIEV